ncbi:MAG TPA: response regulator transcription factor [Mycobacteriales bacterium]|nr:response regulator transcription factor [Mycobacteriales bacterium]
MSYRILVVEDDHGLRDVLARGLREEGYRVRTAVDGATTLRSLVDSAVDAVVLDIALPDGDGRDVCTALRARGIDVPIVFLTARDTMADRLSGFAAGGDDYLGKPFEFAELTARLRAVLRRAADPTRRWGSLSLDPTTHSVSSDGREEPLSPTEFRLLAKLLSAPDTVVRRRELIAAAWPAGACVSDNTLDQYVSKLRRKLARTESGHAIEAARGIGFRLV